MREREQLIVKHCFGLDGYEELNMKEIGEKIGLTRERVRQIKERALERLRHPSRLKRLREIV